MQRSSKNIQSGPRGGSARARASEPALLLRMPRSGSSNTQRRTHEERTEEAEIDKITSAWVEEEETTKQEVRRDGRTPALRQAAGDLQKGERANTREILEKKGEKNKKK